MGFYWPEDLVFQLFGLRKIRLWLFTASLWWKSIDNFKQIRAFISFDRDMISHIYREENQVVDSFDLKGWK